MTFFVEKSETCPYVTDPSRATWWFDLTANRRPRVELARHCGSLMTRRKAHGKWQRLLQTYTPKETGLAPWKDGEIIEAGQVSAHGSPVWLDPKTPLWKHTSLKGIMVLCLGMEKLQWVYTKELHLVADSNECGSRRRGDAKGLRTKRHNTLWAKREGCKNRPM